MGDLSPYVKKALLYGVEQGQRFLKGELEKPDQGEIIKKTPETLVCKSLYGGVRWYFDVALYSGFVVYTANEGEKMIARYSIDGSELHNCLKSVTNVSPSLFCEDGSSDFDFDDTYDGGYRCFGYWGLSNSNHSQEEEEEEEGVYDELHGSLNFQDLYPTALSPAKDSPTALSRDLEGWNVFVKRTRSIRRKKKTLIPSPELYK